MMNSVVPKLILIAFTLINFICFFKAQSDTIHNSTSLTISRRVKRQWPYYGGGGYYGGGCCGGGIGGYGGGYSGGYGFGGPCCQTMGYAISPICCQMHMFSPCCGSHLPPMIPQSPMLALPPPLPPPPPLPLLSLLPPLLPTCCSCCMPLCLPTCIRSGCGIFGCGGFKKALSHRKRELDKSAMKSITQISS